ncbi:hypothetical protein GCM10009530_13590 [Microbispora corallina]|uniref:NACHT domain-containing protein n=1 Tax=Microbispora corallina TaxID=83302 RepID=A0ABQ4FSZ8_9ACTN|nr:hypothetical protein [Microbispora corallina]GIH37944.1 hypothetical protein Mco01_09440 [Microbispora corallina]
MRKGRLTAALAAAVSAILLPVAVNVATGGTLPAELEPYRSWAWPCVAVLGLAVVWFAVDAVTPGADPARDRPYGRTRPETRGRAADNVRAHLTRRLDLKLGDVLRVDVRLEDRPEAVEPILSNRVRRLDTTAPVTTSVRKAFDDLDRSMVLLGRPGAGKTTQLLELALSLLDEKDGPIPVLLDLGGWGRTRSLLPFLDRRKTVDDLRGWLLAQAQERYGIGARVGREWLDDGELALLLDGLDEVPEEARGRLTRLIDELHGGHRDLTIAVSSRSAEYAASPALALNGAVVILPLGRDDVTAYLSASGSRFADLRRALDADGSLWDVIDSPFWLHVLAAVAGDPALGDPKEPLDPADRRRRILDLFVARALRRPRREMGRYAPETVVRWLGQLATVARTSGSTVVATRFDLISRYAQTVPLRLVSPVLPPLSIALFVASAVVTGVSLSRGAGALTAIALGWLPASMSIMLPAEAVAAGYMRLPRSAGVWVTGLVAAIPVTFGEFQLQDMLLSGPGASWAAAAASGSTVFVAAAAVGVVAVLVPFFDEDEARADRSRSVMGRGVPAVWALTCAVSLPPAVLGAVAWTGPFADAVGGVLLGTSVAAGAGVVIGMLLTGSWLPRLVLVAAGLLPVRLTDFYRYAASAGLLVPDGENAYRFLHQIFVDHFAEHPHCADSSSR